MNNDFDLYDILNVNPDADFNEIKTAYRKLARKYHPDFNSSKEAEERIKLINIAYGILSDPAKRQQYDFMRRYGIPSNNVYSTNYGDSIVFKDLSEFFEFISNLPQEELDQLFDSLFNQLFYNFIKGLLDLGAQFRRRIINTFGNAFERIEKTARYILDPFGMFRKRSD